MERPNIRRSVHPCLLAKNQHAETRMPNFNVAHHGNRCFAGYLSSLCFLVRFVFFVFLTFACMQERTLVAKTAAFFCCVSGTFESVPMVT